MPIKFHKTILNLFFCAFALIALSACGGGSSGGGNAGNETPGGGDETPVACDNNLIFCNTPDKIAKATCNSNTHDCTTGLRTCNPETHFCATSGVAKIGCDSNTHDCDGTGEQTCNPSTHFCATSGVAKMGCDSNTHDCDGTGEQTCNPSTHFCATSGVAKIGCDSNTHDCDGTGEQTCNPSTHFCATSGVAKIGCEPRSYDCTTGVALDCNDLVKFCNTPDEIVRADCAALGTHDCDTGLLLTVTCNAITTNCHTGMAHALDDDGNIIVPAYVAPDLASDAPGSFTAWEGTGGALAPHQTDEYDNDGGAAARIGAAYAYARGHDGTGVTVSIIGYPTVGNHRELSGKLVQGYQADGADDAARTATDAGTCTTTCSPTLADYNSHNAAGIIAGLKDGLSETGYGRQGIAYGAKIKPIDLTTGFVHIANNEARRTALKRTIEEAASGAGITATQYALARSTVAAYEHPDDNLIYNYSTTRAISNIHDVEKTAWETAVATTVVITPQGDNGQNSLNGRVKETFRRGDDSSFEFKNNVLWSVIDSSNTNRGTAHGRLPSVVTSLQGKWLTVIALDSSDVIHQYSNGCGDAMAWCLGAPGVNIESLSRTSVSYFTYTNTHTAAAHVTGAVAVLKSAFTHLTPAELVSVILETADDLGEPGIDEVYGYGRLNLARATEPVGSRTVALPSAPPSETGLSLDDSGITLPTSFGGALDGFTVGFMDDYKRAFIGFPTRIARGDAAFTLGDTLATWESPELKNIQLDSNSKMQFTNYDENSDAKDTLIFTHNLPNHTIGFSYNEESKSPDLNLANAGEELHFQKIRPIASDLMQLHATHKLGKAWNVKNAITSGAFDTGNRFNEAMANLNYTGKNHQLTIGAGTLQEYGQFLGASGTGAYQLSDATQSTVTHLAISQNLPLNSAIKVKYTGFKTEVDMRYKQFR